MASTAARMRRQSRRSINASSTSAVYAMNPFSDTFVLQSDNYGPLWYAEDVRYPQQVGAGGVVDIAVDMANARTVITPLNADQCTDGLTNGLRSEITIQPDWTEGQTVTDCLGAGGFTPTRRTHEFDFPAPTEPGTYSFAVEVRAPGSGEGGIETFQVVIPDPDAGGGDGDGDGDDNYVDPRPGAGDGDDSPDNTNGDDPDDEREPLFTPTTIIGIVAVLAGIGALAVS